MTKYWPASMMLKSAALRPEQKLELMNFRLTGISEQTLQLCHNLTKHWQGMDITMLYTEGNPALYRRVYMKRPTYENWLALERNIFIDTGENFGFNVDVLH